MTSNMNKIYKPGECMKHMTVEMHPVLLEAWYCADVRREVCAAGARVSASDAVCDPALVLWARTIPPTGEGRSLLQPLQPRQARCDLALVVLQASEAAPLVASRQLAQRARTARALAGVPVTVLIVQAKDYFKSGRQTQNSTNKKITEIELEMALTDLLVSAECDAAVVNTPSELALLIAHFTKALAEAPHKKAKRALDEQADFYMRADNKQCISIDKDGHGCPRLWQQMMAILPHSSLEISRAICAQYKTPRQLYEAVQKANAVQEIADIGVSRALVPGARARRVGPEFARRLHALFTADDGDEVLD